MSTNNRDELNIKAREVTGGLFYSMIEGSVTPREVVNLFPKNSDDISLKIAWNALLHYDADEEMRINDYEYAQEQIKYIEFIAKILSEGNELPKNMLDDYEALHAGTIMPKKYNWLGKLKAFFRYT